MKRCSDWRERINIGLCGRFAKSRSGEDQSASTMLDCGGGLSYLNEFFNEWEKNAIISP